MENKFGKLFIRNFLNFYAILEKFADGDKSTNRITSNIIKSLKNQVFSTWQQIAMNRNIKCLLMWGNFFSVVSFHFLSNFIVISNKYWNLYLLYHEFSKFSQMGKLVVSFCCLNIKLLFLRTLNFQGFFENLKL